MFLHRRHRGGGYVPTWKDVFIGIGIALTLGGLAAGAGWLLAGWVK